MTLEHTNDTAQLARKDELIKLLEEEVKRKHERLGQLEKATSELQGTVHDKDGGIEALKV
jgi:hypothetical protein